MPDKPVKSVDGGGPGSGLGGRDSGVSDGVEACAMLSQQASVGSGCSANLVDCCMARPHRARSAYLGPRVRRGF